MRRAIRTAAAAVGIVVALGVMPPAFADSTPTLPSRDIVTTPAAVDGCLDTLLATVIPGPFVISPDDLVTFTPPATVTVHADFLVLWASRDVNAVVAFVICVG